MEKGRYSVYTEMVVFTIPIPINLSRFKNFKKYIHFLTNPILGMSRVRAVRRFGLEKNVFRKES